MNPLSDYDPSRLQNLILASFITEKIWLDILVIVIIIICLAFSSFFSSAETAISSANSIRLRKLVEEKKRGAHKASLLIDNYDRTITTILIGNNLANIGASTAAVFIFTNLIRNHASIANITSTVVMTLLVIIFGEIIPKTYAKANATKVATNIAGMLWFFYKLFFPLSFIFMKLANAVKGKEVTEELTVTGEELETIIDTMEDQGVIDEDHADLLQGALSLGNKRVYDIMTPRVDVEAIEIEDTIDEILELFFESKYTRLPVYSEDKDNILGILQEKDFLSAVIKIKDKSKINIKDLITEPLYVTKATRVDDLIKEMQEAKKHFAIVSDEYGGTSGIVTMEDALEELVGEIYDEYDHDEEDVYINEVGPNTYILDADYELEDLYELLDVGPEPEGTYATVGGFVYDLCEGLPEVGMIISVNSIKTNYEGEKVIDTTYKLTYELTAVVNRRIRQLKLTVEEITDENTNNEE